MNKISKSKKNITITPVEKKNSQGYNDFMSFFFVVTILLIDFLPYFQSYQIIAPQYLYLTVMNVIIGFYIYANPNLHNKNLLLIFKQGYLFKMYLAFIALCGISIFSAKNISLGILSMAEIIVILATIINLVILFYNRMYLVYKVAFIIGVCAFFQAGIALYHFKIIATTTSISEALNSNFLKGNTGNINIFSASTLYKIPFIYIGIVYFNKWRRWFLACALVLSTTIIFFINARASLLSLIIITIVFLVSYLINSIHKKTALKHILFVVIPLAISLFAVNLIFSQSKLDARFKSTSDRLKQINSGDNSINRRLIFYRAAVDLAKKNPITGIGLGNYRVESIPYDYSTNESVPLHAHDDFLELTAETGIINGILYLSIFIFLLVINLKTSFKTKDKEIKNVALLILLLIIVYGVDALFNFPFYLPTMQLCFCFLVVFTLVNNVGIKETEKADKRLFIGLIVLGLIPLYFTYYAYQTSHLEYLIQTDNINFEPSGVLNGNDVVSRNPKIPNVFQSAESFVEYAGIYYFREKEYDTAIKLLDSANKINPYMGRPDFYKYLIATETAKADSAYIYIKRAFYNRPVNDLFYDKALIMATAKRDTFEILKMYNNYALIPHKSGSWAKAFTALSNSGYSKNRLNEFEQIADKNFPKDSVVSQAINAIKITNFIIKGQALFAEGKYDMALQSYNEGLKLEPKNIYILQNIGFYYYNLNKPNEAISYFKQALDKPGLNDGKTQFFIGMSYLRINDKDSACKYFNLAGDYPDAKSKLSLNCK